MNVFVLNTKEDILKNYHFWVNCPLKSLRYICSNSQQYIVWVKIIDFSFMTKIIRILRSCSMKIFSKFPTVNISKLNFWLVICIAKNLIWITLKVIFSIFWFFLHPQIPDLPNIVQTIHQWKAIYSALRWCIHLNLEKLTSMTGFVLQSHIWSLWYDIYMIYILDESEMPRVSEEIWCILSKCMRLLKTKA